MRYKTTLEATREGLHPVREFFAASGYWILLHLSHLEKFWKGELPEEERKRNWVPFASLYEGLQVTRGAVTRIVKKPAVGITELVTNDDTANSD